MQTSRVTVGVVADVPAGSGTEFARISGLPAAIIRPHHQVEAVLAQSMAEMGTRGRVWQAWRWVLNGDQPSPVTLGPAPGQAPSREQILAEADTVICADIAEVRVPRRPYRVVASPPYRHSSLVLRSLLSPRSQLISAGLMLQRAVVRKYASGQDALVEPAVGRRAGPIQRQGRRGVA